MSCTVSPSSLLGRFLPLTPAGLLLFTPDPPLPFVGTHRPRPVQLLPKLTTPCGGAILSFSLQIAVPMGKLRTHSSWGCTQAGPPASLLAARHWYGGNTCALGSWETEVSQCETSCAVCGMVQGCTLSCLSSMATAVAMPGCWAPICPAAEALPTPAPQQG